MSSDSESSQEKKKPISPQKGRNGSQINRGNSFQPPPMMAPLQSSIIDSTDLFQQNRKLRRKLKQLSVRLDEQLQKAVDKKLKQNNNKNGHPMSIQSQNMELQNAYKMIERLQKTVRDYQSKQSYQITLKRVMDLESIIKKKQAQMQQQKTQIKTQKKMLKDKDRRIEQLIESTQKMGNPAQDKQTINKLKAKLKKMAQQNQQLRKKQLQKHDKLVKAERRIVDLQQNENQMPIGKEQGLVKDNEQLKKKYKETMQRVQRQNIYISKLNQKLNNQAVQQKSRKSERMSQRMSEKGEQRKVARSMEDLPSLEKKINISQMLGHLPSPKQVAKLKRY